MIRRFILKLALFALVPLGTAGCRSVSEPAGVPGGSDKGVLVVSNGNVAALGTVNGQLVGLHTEGGSADSLTGPPPTIVREPLAGVSIDVYLLTWTPTPGGDPADTLGTLTTEHYEGPVVTNAQGRFQLQNVPAGYYAFKVHPPSGSQYGTSDVQHDLWTDGKSTQEFPIEIWRAASAVGQVVSRN